MPPVQGSFPIPPGTVPWKPGDPIPSGGPSFCAPIRSGVPGSVGTDRPDVQGYTYQSVMLAEEVGNPGVAFTTAIVPPAGSYIFSDPVIIAAMWLATTIVNPTAVVAAVAVGKNREGTTDLNRASQLFFQHITASPNTISRTGGFAFGENNGLLINPGDSFGVYVSGNDASLEVTYMLNIVYLNRIQTR